MLVTLTLPDQESESITADQAVMKLLPLSTARQLGRLKRDVIGPLQRDRRGIVVKRKTTDQPTDE